MADTTIIYLGHDAIDKEIKDLCLDHLLKTAPVPIIQMHQPPDWELSGLSMYKQIKAGLKQVKTKWVAIAEHDCLYTEEHWNFTPPNDRYFWYNQNNWLLQHENPSFPELNGTFTHWPNRRVQSQLICDAEKLREVTEVQIAVTGDPRWPEIRGKRPVGEPGTIGEKALRLTNGSKYQSLHSRIKDYLIGYEAKDFSTEKPNIDIRHGKNFTGPRRGKKRTRTLHYWGTWRDIMQR